MGATISADKILKELSDLFVTQGKAGEAAGGVLRACTMTLVVLSDESSDIQALGETIAALMPEHPARTILIRLSGPGGRNLTERVYSQCWMPFGQRQQICCEQVEITASDASLEDLPFVLLPLAAADLPLILWNRSARLTSLPAFWRLTGIAQKVIMDSASMEDPISAIALVAAAAGSGVLVGDLAWTRMTRWRQMLAQVFQNRQNVTRLESLKSVEIECSDAYRVSAHYMLEWMKNCLADANVKLDGSIGAAEAGVTMRVRLVGDGFEALLQRQEDRFAVTVNGETNTTNLPQPSDYLAMREELRIVRRDPVFERTLASASLLAYPTDK